MTMADITLLIVDDEEQMRKVLTYIIQNSDYSYFQIREASSAEEALKILESENVDIIICDYLLQNMGGIEFFSNVSLKYPYTVNILISGNVNYEQLRSSVARREIFKFLSKPFNEEVIMNVLSDAIEKVKENRLKKDLSDRLKDFD